MLRDCIWQLSLAPGIGSAAIIRVLEILGVSVGQVPADTPVLRERLHLLHDSGGNRELLRSHGFTARVTNSIVQVLADTDSFARERALITRAEVTVTTCIDAAYPAQLLSIYLPPAVLYSVGAPLADISERSLAIVGSRLAGTYAHNVISALTPELVQDGWTIVSGGAIGADTMAHRAALDANGKTIAILGAGLGEPYPASNKKLFREIVEKGGTIVSPFSYKTIALPGNFPARNRIIAGLSRGCLLVQAAVKSGARITAQCALEQGKLVWAVPGSIFDPLSAGCHAIIGEGAIPVSSAQDIFASLSGERMYHSPTVVAPKTPALNTAMHLPSATEPQVTPESEHVTKHTSAPKSHTFDTQNTQNNGVLAAKQSAQVPTATEADVMPASLEDRVVHVLSEQRSLDELAILFAIGADELYDTLFMLQLDGRVQQNFAGHWQRV